MLRFLCLSPSPFASTRPLHLASSSSPRVTTTTALLPPPSTPPPLFSLSFFPLTIPYTPHQTASSRLLLFPSGHRYDCLAATTHSSLLGSSSSYGGEAEGGAQGEVVWGSRVGKKILQVRKKRGWRRWVQGQGRDWGSRVGKGRRFCRTFPSPAPAFEVFNTLINSRLPPSLLLLITPTPSLPF
ncbi:unnamed protein product [Closterium sp. NIES-64]|nr:unnamed protein product [Closterium sp. NIES-65]CAI5995607.1 unnamed protein product [Closterium sp. NIES-64]